MLYIMKKLFIATLAIAALASCNKDQVINFDKFPINFGDAFVDNATKAIYEGETKVDAFKVWGTVTGNGNTVLIFDGADVTRTKSGSADKKYGEAWYCDVTRYWTPSCTYNFTAIVDATSVTPTNGAMPTAINYTADGVSDLLYGVTDTDAIKTSADCTVTGLNANNCVAFTMKHLLSKMYFEVVSGLESPYTIKVTNIVVSDIQQKGKYTIGAATPWAKDGDTTTSFDFIDGAKVIIPVEQTLDVAITYDVLFNDTTISQGVTKTGTIPATTYAENTVYKVSATIGLTEIQFSISTVEGFGSDTNVTVQ